MDKTDNIVVPYTIATAISDAKSEDVIYGRGNRLKNHPGNMYYRSLIKAIREYYVIFPKDKKRLVSKIIFDSIKNQDPPGRFLTETHDGQFMELEVEDTLRKISQCLREKQSEIKSSSRRKKKLSNDEIIEKIRQIQVSFSWR